MKKLIAAFAQNSVFSTIAIASIFLAGLLAVYLMPRETYPEFSLERITITVPYPGADPEEVEEGVCRKIETALEGMPGIRNFTTFSSEGVCTADVEVKESSAVAITLDRVRTKVNAIASFPEGAKRPIVAEVLLRTPVILVSLSSAMSERRLKEWANEFEYELQQSAGVSQVEVFGTRDYEIGIEVSEERLREYGLTFNAVADAIRRSSVNISGGTIRTQSEEIRVRTVGQKHTAKELASIVVLAKPEGEIITLDRVAVIDDGFTDDPVFASVNGEPAVLLSVYKTRDDDALAVSEAVSRFVEKKARQLPEGVRIKVLYDNTNQLKSRIDMLVDNGLYGLWLVFLMLWLLLGWRLSFWVGIGSLAPMIGAMAIVWAMGGTINMISLLALILVSGILVDDGIVFSEAIFTRRQQGAEPLQAVVEGISEVSLPVIAAVIVNIIAYIPLFFIGGVTGKFISILPTVTILSMVISILEAMLIMPAHIKNMPVYGAENPKQNIFQRFQTTTLDAANRALGWIARRVYAPLSVKALSHRYVTVSIFASLFLFSLGLVQSGLFKFEFLPEIDGDIIGAEIEYPAGTPAEVTRAALKKADQAFVSLAERTKTRSGEPLIVDRIAVVGQNLVGSEGSGSHIGSMQVVLLESEKRAIQSKDLMAAWEKEIGPVPGIQALRFEGMGSVSGVPIEIWIQGHHMEPILAAAQKLMARLQQFEGVYQVHSDFRPGKNEIRLELKPEARALGLTAGDLAGQVHAGYYGEEAIRIQRGREEIKVKVRYTAEERSRVSNLDRVRIRTGSGQTVPLLSVADVSFAPGYTTITRTNGMRRVAVKAAVDTAKANPNEIIAELSTGFLEELPLNHPGVIISIQGEQKSIEDSFRSLVVGYPLALLAIFVVIASAFRSYVQPLLIVLTIPFGFIGCLLGHLLLGYDISIMSVMGMVALSGVIVNDSIVLLDRINNNIAQGLLFSDAVREAVIRRLRPILLTTITTVVGVAPLILETDFQARMIVPMAISLAGGLTFSTVCDLVFMPSLLGILNDLRRFVHRLRFGEWPSPESVEPSNRGEAAEELEPHLIFPQPQK